MIGLILVCAALLSFVIDLSVWQGITVVVLVMGAYGTGRVLQRPHVQGGAK